MVCAMESTQLLLYAATSITSKLPEEVNSCVGFSKKLKVESSKSQILKEGMQILHFKKIILTTLSSFIIIG